MTVNRESNTAELAEKVREALSSGDLDSYRDLLAADAHWGPPDQPSWGCHNRNQILDWYKKSQRGGMRATINEVVAGPASILVGMTVTGTDAAEEAGKPGGGAPRWQVMTVRNGRIVDIAGFDNRPDASERAGLPPAGLAD